MRDAVLIVDDSLTVRMDLADAFEAAGLRAIPCATAAAARAVMAAETPSVVILDVILPDGDGVQLLGELRARESSARTVVVMLSTEAEVKDRVRALTTGADEYVGKPYDAGYVVAKAQELLAARRTQPSARERPTVVLIDDSVTFREALREALEAAGNDVLVAASGEEGLRMAAAHRPTAVVVDGVLPGMDGATVIRTIRLDAALRGLACILLTGSEGEGAELRALEAGADAFVRKDEDMELILARVAAAMRAVATPGAQTASLLGPKKVLAVDDSPIYLDALGDALRGDGYDVVLARSGEEALELLAVQTVDCILIDLMMPGLGGKETCRRIKDAPIVRDIPLIILTALDDREAMIDGLGAGADDYISKSSDLHVLRARVRAQIRRKQFEDENRRIREQLLQKELEAAEARSVRALAETRAALVAELEAKNEELEAFSYSVSHDLRAPLRSIDGFSAALLEDYEDKLDEAGRGHLRRVRAATRRMGELIDDLLHFSRVGRAALHRASVDVSQLAATVVSNLRSADPARKVDVIVEEGLTAHADAGLLRLVLENLLGNAWKFTSRAEHARIEVRAITQGGHRAYQIRDNGAGFDMTHATRLFTPFQRLHAEAEYPGTGIGLATVRRIVERHGGKIWVDASVGEGATFSFTLPTQT
jgi:two-component system, NtrC family, sensor kinase